MIYKYNEITAYLENELWLIYINTNKYKKLEINLSKLVKSIKLYIFFSKIQKINDKNQIRSLYKKIYLW